MSILRYFRGALGLSKAAVGIDRAPPQKQRLRFKICGDCPYIYEAPTNFPFYERFGPWACRQCGCLVKAKLQIDRERCPLGKW